jgi:DNA-directed RNA polymerase
MNLTKQKNALMPNLVHSLDATSMILLYYSLKKTVSKKNYTNFYSVHDCFGVTADKVELLITLIRNIYIDIYSNNKYIETFDKDVIENIKIHFGGEGKVKYIEDRREIIVDIDKTIKLPEIPTNRLDVKIIKDYYKKLNKALLLIN